MARTDTLNGAGARDRSIAQTLAVPRLESAPEALRAHRRIDTHHHPQLPFWLDALADS